MHGACVNRYIIKRRRKSTMSKRSLHFAFPSPGRKSADSFDPLGKRMIGRELVFQTRSHQE